MLLLIALMVLFGLLVMACYSEEGLLKLYAVFGRVDLDEKLR